MTSVAMHAGDFVDRGIRGLGFLGRFSKYLLPAKVELSQPEKERMTPEQRKHAINSVLTERFGELLSFERCHRVTTLSQYSNACQSNPVMKPDCVGGTNFKRSGLLGASISPVLDFAHPVAR